MISVTPQEESISGLKSHFSGVSLSFFAEVTTFCHEHLFKRPCLLLQSPAPGRVFCVTFQPNHRLPVGSWGAALLASHAFMHICLPSPEASICRSPYQKSLKTLSTLTQDSVLFHSLFFPTGIPCHQLHKMALTFCLGASSAVR